MEQRQNVSDDGTEGIPYVIFRLPDVLGPRDTTYRFWVYQLWIRMAAVLTRHPVTIPKFLIGYNNSFVYVDDVAGAIVDVIGSKRDVATDQVTGHSGTFRVLYSNLFDLLFNTDDIVVFNAEC
jgi:nucleoside-diphosphate-sugar epimerase